MQILFKRDYFKDQHTLLNIQNLLQLTKLKAA
jgi:hypothetical protein